MTAGQCRVVKDSWDLMMAILWGRMDYLKAMNAEVVSLDNAIEALPEVRRRLAEEVHR